MTFGGGVRRAEGAQVRGGETQAWNNSRFGIGGWPGIVIRTDPLAQSTGVLLNSLVLAALALLVVLFLPGQTARVADAIQRAPAPSGGMGLLTAIAAPVLLVMLAITICLSPFSLLGGLALAAGLLFGWVALGQLAGNRLAAALNWHSASPAGAAALGTFVLTLTAGALSIAIPCVGGLIPLLVSAVGLGGVVLTRFGWRPYLPGLPPVAAPPPPPAPEEPLAA